MSVKVICGFPGVGKSFVTKSRTDLRISDSDSSKFSWQSEGVRHPNFPANYIAYIQSLITSGATDIILVSSHDVVRASLVEAGIRFELAYPGREMKEEYLDRYESRGNTGPFVQMLREKWDSFMTEMEEQKGCLHLRLRSGEHLSDYIE